MVVEDPFHLQRFIEAQRSVYATVLKELRGGQKQSHWMWFIFPQIAGLGRSPMAKDYAIHSREEAVAFLTTPLLGARLVECTALVLDIPHKSAHEIFGSPDDLKFRSSMTLFDAARPDSLFRKAIDRFFDGQPDETTLTIMKNMAIEKSADRD